MIIYAMDRDYVTLKSIDEALQSGSGEKPDCFTNISALLEAVKKETPEMIFLDADSKKSMTAYLALQTIDPNTKIVLMSSSNEQAMNAMQMGVFGYLTKPIVKEKVEEYISRAKHPILAKLR